MDPAPGAAPQRRAFSRVPLRAKVRMEFVEQRCFLGEWAVNLSAGGMFVRSEAPVAPGQRFDFDAALTPSGPRFLGRGEVLWVRREWEGASRPPGFAVRFLELEEAGRRAIQHLGEVFLQRGVAAMQQELAALAEEFQRQRLEDEPTGELGQAATPEGVLPDTAVIDPGAWTEPPAQESGAAAAEARASPAPSETASEALERTDPAHVPPAEVPPRPEPRRPRRRAGWLGALALLVVAVAFVGFWRAGVASRAEDAAAEARRADSRSAIAERARPAAASLPPSPAGPAAAVPAAFQSLQGVSWSEAPEGLWVTLSLDGALPEGAWRHWRAASPPPREVLELLGARRGYPRQQVTVGSPLLEQIRFGFHPGGDGDELRVVLDLASPAVSVRRVESEGLSLRVLLGADPPPPARPADLPPGTAQ